MGLVRLKVYKSLITEVFMAEAPNYLVRESHVDILFKCNTIFWKS